MRQPSDDRALYYRQLRATISTVLAPELTSAQAIDSAALIDRILAEFIVEEEMATTLSEQYGGAFRQLLDPTATDKAPASPAQFHELRARAADVVADSAGSGNAAARQMAQQLVETERAFLEEVEEARIAVFAEGDDGSVGPSATACSVTPAQVTAYLRRKMPDSPDLDVKDLTVVPGGRSKETILVSLSGTSELPDEVILRKDRPVGLLQTRAADEYAVIKAVHDYGGVPVPQPFFSEQDGYELGEGTFLVMERVAGHKAGEFFPDLAAPTEHGHEIGLQLAAGLARLHSLPLDRLGETNLGADDASVSEESVVAMVEGIAVRIGELTGPPCATVPLARQWLIEHVSDVVPAPRLSLLQGDFGFHNMLVDGPRLTALVDWEGATIGPPARELAAAWRPVRSLMDWSTFVDAYVAAGGQPDDADQRAINYYRVLSSLGGFMASRMGGHMFRSGTKRDLLTAHSGLDAHFRCARNLARDLSDARGASAAG